MYSERGLEIYITVSLGRVNCGIWNVNLHREFELSTSKVRDENDEVGFNVYIFPLF